MPQAVKHYTGTASGLTTTTVYTCPASTIAIVVPTITVRHGATGKYTTFGWNSSSAATQVGGNLSFYYYSGTPDYVNVSAIDKYNVLATVPKNTDANSKTYFSASYTTLTNSNTATVFSSSGLTANNPIAPDGQSGGSVHATGPWVMSAGHVLSYHTDVSTFLTYNFLIIEEAAS